MELSFDIRSVGHLGVTPARVTGLVRVVVTPSFSADHTEIASAPVLVVKLTGVVGTGRSAKTIHSDAMRLGDALDAGLRGAGRMLLLPGAYDVPFVFALPPILPPSFANASSRVAYTLNAELKFRERKAGGLVAVVKSISEEVVVRTLTGESDAVAENFTEPATFSNLDTNDPVRYHVMIPSRSFGPDDEIVANVHISKLPEGCQVHHIDVVVRAEVQSKTPKGNKVTMQTILKHREIPEHAASFWNHKIRIGASRLFPNQNSDVVDTSEDNDVDDGGDQESEMTSDSFNAIPTVHPPEFDGLNMNDFELPENFANQPFQNRRAFIIEALATVPQPGLFPSDIAHDSGLSAGNSAVFQPWVQTSENTEALSRSPSMFSAMRRTQSIDADNRSLRAGSLRAGSIRAASIRSTARPTSPLIAPTSPLSTAFSFQGFRRERSARASTSTVAVPVVPISPAASEESDSNGSDEEEEEGEMTATTADSISISVALDSLREPDPSAPSPIPVSATSRPGSTTTRGGGSIVIQNLNRAFSMRSQNSFSTTRSTRAFNVAPITEPVHEQPPLPHRVSFRTTSPQQPPLTATRPELTQTATTSAPPTTPSTNPSFHLPAPLRRMLRRMHILPTTNLDPPDTTMDTGSASSAALTTFTSPFLSVRHTLTVTIVCHKPMPLLGGSQPIYIPTPVLRDTAVRGQSLASLIKKAVPVGFRFDTTAVETGCVVHSASERDRTFLQGYLYGPGEMGGGGGGGRRGSGAPAYEDVVGNAA
ncbi:hypothetical protein HDU98_010924 [Podochytrium sp. JEL0797]|nr:hypothetical protein HDU98_010924 [Podochytrium sp. JEL0797]